VPIATDPPLENLGRNLSKRVAGAPLNLLPAASRFATATLNLDILRQARQKAHESVETLRPSGQASE
jgi:hypothetical protein